MITHLHHERAQTSAESDCIKRAGGVEKSPVFTEPQKRVAEIRVAISADTFSEIRTLRKREYKAIYPDMDLDNDVLDKQAITLFTRGTDGRINSTARLGVDGRHKLPEHEFLHEYHAQDARLMEWGRFIICDGDTPLLKSYYETVFTLAVSLGFDAIVMAMRPNHIPLHKRLIGARIVVPDMGIDYGGSCNLACVVWELEATKPEFFNWIWR